MAGTLDSILNFIIPIAVFILIGWILYKAFAPITQGLGSKVGEWWGNMTNREPEVHYVKSIEYE